MNRFDEIIEKIPLFSGIEKEKLPGVLQCLKAEIKEYQKGQIIFCEGDPAGDVGAVLSGSVQIIRDDYYGNRSIITTVYPAQIFAEVFSCADVETMPVGVRAETDTVVMLMDCKKLLHTWGHASAHHSTLIHNLVRIIARKNLVLNRKIELMSKRTTKEKVMAFLLMQAKEHGGNSFAIPYDRQTLADYLGVERSAMSAEIGKLRAEGVIEVDKKNFKILRTL